MAKINYRLTRLRRLWGLCVGLCALGATMHAWQADLSAPFEYIAIVVACAAFGFGALLVKLPNGWIDAISIALATMIILALWGPICAILDVFFPPTVGISAIWRLFVTSFGAVFLVLGLIWLIGMMEHLPWRERSIHSRFTVDLTPQQAFDALAIRPDMTRGNKSYGAPGPDGFFRVTMTTEFPDLETFEVSEHQDSYDIRILDEGPLWQHCLCSLTLQGRSSTSVTVLKVSQTRGGALCTVSERQDHLGLLANIGFWVNDYGTDAHLATIDDFLDRESLANSRQSYDTLLSTIARWMIRVGLSPKPEG